MQATIAGVKISPATLAQTIALIEDGTISSKIAKELAPELLEGAAEAAGVAALVEERGMGQISDDAAILAMIDEAIAGNPKQLEQYRCAPPLPRCGAGAAVRCGHRGTARWEPYAEHYGGNTSPKYTDSKAGAVA